MARSPGRRRPHTVVDESDVAAVVAALVEDGHAGRTYVPTGPQALTPVQAAQVIGNRIGCSGARGTPIGCRPRKVPAVGGHKRYRIAAELRTQILSGALGPGARLPSREELTLRHDASGQTVTTAIDMLKADGLVETRNGLGWFVRHPIRVDLLRSSGQWFDRNARPGSGEETWSPEVRAKISFCLAPPRVSEHLEIGRNAEVCLRTRTMHKADQVLCLGRTYLPRALTRGTAIEDSRGAGSGTYGMLHKLGHRIKRFTETVGVVPATEIDAELFGFDPRRPPSVLQVTRTAHGDNDHRLEVDYIIAPAGRVSLVYDLPGFR